MLKKLYIHNFKSFWNSRFEFGKLNCLIAPNNSGKSNLIEVIEFCDKLLFPRENDEEKINFSQLKNFRHNEENITFELEFELEQRVLVYHDLFDYKYNVKFNIVLGTVNNIDLEVDGYIKHIVVLGKDNKNISSQTFGTRLYDNELENDIENYDKYNEEIQAKRYTKFNLKYSQNTLNYELNCPSTIKESIAILFGFQLNAKNDLTKPIKFKNIFSKKIFVSYDFQPYLIKSQTISSFQLNKIGTNLVEFIAGQLDDTIEDISTSLIGEVEQVNSIKVDKDSAHKTLYFVEEGGYEVPLKNTSDGTVHFLAIMSALISNESNTIAMMFEEPERHMHMKVLSYLLNSMRDNKAQVFFTTHSTEMLSELKLDEIIFMFRDYNGDTKGIRAKDIVNIDKLMKIYKKDLVEMIKIGILDDLEDEL